jgi:hypothetical protein
MIPLRRPRAAGHDVTGRSPLMCGCDGGHRRQGGDAAHCRNFGAWRWREFPRCFLSPRSICPYSALFRDSFCDVD